MIVVPQEISQVAQVITEVTGTHAGIHANSNSAMPCPAVSNLFYSTSDSGSVRLCNPGAIIICFLEFFL